MQLVPSKTISVGMIYVAKVTYRQQRDGNFSKKIRGFISIFIKHCHFQNIMNIFNRTGTKSADA